jgi:hypothetical protein
MTRTVKRSKLSRIHMVAGGEKRHPTVILDGNVKDWVGFGWIDLGPADDEDREKYPVVVDDTTQGA